MSSSNVEFPNIKHLTLLKSGQANLDTIFSDLIKSTPFWGKEKSTLILLKSNKSYKKVKLPPIIQNLGQQNTGLKQIITF